jgi:hypothetical protein
MLFNDEDDKDPDSLLSTNNTPLTFNTANEAFLKYTNAISAKANGQVSLNDIGFNATFLLPVMRKHCYYKSTVIQKTSTRHSLLILVHSKHVLRFRGYSKP